VRKFSSRSKWRKLKLEQIIASKIIMSINFLLENIYFAFKYKIIFYIWSQLNVVYRDIRVALRSTLHWCNIVIAKNTWACTDTMKVPPLEDSPSWKLPSEHRDDTKKSVKSEEEYERLRTCMTRRCIGEKSGVIFQFQKRNGFSYNFETALQKKRIRRLTYQECFNSYFYLCTYLIIFIVLFYILLI